MEEPTDEELMNAYAEGDLRAFERLYARHRAPLYRYVMRLAKDPATANDLFQGTWEKIIRARRGYRSDAPFKAWMYRIAHNHVMDHFRRSRPGEHQPLHDWPDTWPGDDPGPEQRLEETRREADLSAAVQSLSAEQREAVLLRLEAGLDTRTIADVTGVNPETAKSRLRYAVAHLRNMLDQ
jgi:RNA polymerase sigma factor (sigma-70 family)